MAHRRDAVAARRLGLIGCGAIGSRIAEAIGSGVLAYRLVAAMDLEPDRCRRVASLAHQEPRITRDIGELLDAGPDIVVEAASQEAVRLYAEEVLRRGIDLVVLSVGALLDRGLLARLRSAASGSGARIHVPSGAVAGLDAIRAHRLAGIQRVVLRTVKPPASLGLEAAGGRRLLYRGPASEAVKRYPFNVNVAAAVSLAAGREAVVEVVADPGVERNTHVVIVESPAGRLELRVENVPDPGNPRTSLLASLSVIELLRRLSGSEPLEVGT